jgi:hypothetical protein
VASHNQQEQVSSLSFHRLRFHKGENSIFGRIRRQRERRRTLPRLAMPASKSPSNHRNGMCTLRSAKLTDRAAMLEIANPTCFLAPWSAAPKLSRTFLASEWHFPPFFRAVLFGQHHFRWRAFAEPGERGLGLGDLLKGCWGIRRNTKMRFRMTISASVFLLATIDRGRGRRRPPAQTHPFTGAFGYFHGRLAGPGVPHGVVGQITADGKGNLTGLFTDSSNGTLGTGTFTGTYSISSNCTGSLTFSRRGAFPDQLQRRSRQQQEGLFR